MHVNATVRGVTHPTPQGEPMPSMKSLVTTGLIALAVVVAYDKYGNRG